jgi:hypothetical protein
MTWSSAPNLGADTFWPMMKACEEKEEEEDSQ